MKSLAALLFSLSVLQASADVESKAGYAALQDVVKQLSTCTNTAGYDKLFAYSLDPANSGAATVETVSAANEDVFLACPKSFLSALIKLPSDQASAILKDYFGIARPPWDIAPKLCQLQKDEQVGVFVRAHFADEIGTFTDKTCKPRLPESSDD